jgi:hypothetical protein
MEMLIQSRMMVRGVVSEDTLYLAYWKWLGPTERAKAAGALRATRAALLAGTLSPVDAWGPIVREELYDLSVDPGATKNLSDSRPEALARWRQFLLDYGATCPPQLPDRYKATRDESLLSDPERALLQGVPDAFLTPRVPDTRHEHQLESLGYL